MHLPTHVTLVEVGPRDGLQNEAVLVDTATKVALINQLSATGLSVIEATSFVSPKWVPQMADHTEVMQQIKRAPHVIYPVLVPNLQGFSAALAAGATHIAVFAAASEAFSQKNIHCSIAESLERFAPVLAAAQTHHIPVRAYISCVLGCPYSGAVSANTVANLAKQLWQLGCTEISLGDTIGTGTPLQTQHLIRTVSQHIPLKNLAVHFHDTYGQAIANCYAALECGITIFDSAIAGLGGCPYAKGASGNVATEDLLYLFRGLNIETGVDFDRVIATGHFICQALKKTPTSKVSLAHLSH